MGRKDDDIQGLLDENERLLAEWAVADEEREQLAAALMALNIKHVVVQEQLDAAEARLRLLRAHCGNSEASAREYDEEYVKRSGYKSFSEAMLTTEMVRSVIGDEDS